MTKITKSVNKEALQLRLAGSSYEQIATALVVSRPAAIKATFAALASFYPEQLPLVTEQRLSTVRYEALTAALWPAVEQGDPKAAKQAARVMNAHARLHGKTSLRVKFATPVAVVEQARSLSIPTPDDLREPAPVAK